MRKNYLPLANAKQLLEYPIHALFQTRFPPPQPRPMARSTRLRPADPQNPRPEMAGRLLTACAVGK
ncbi:MAG: hypothetical protein ACK4P5_02795 [Fimbriimonadales bacterium]